MINLDEFKIYYERCLVFNIDCVIGDFKYSLTENDEIILVDYLGNKESIEVEEGVHILGTNCFSKKEIERVSLPSTLHTIGNNAFSNSTVELVLINSKCGLTIGRKAFYNSFIRTINLENVVKIDIKAFADTSIGFADLSRCEFIGSSAFENTLSLKKVFFNYNKPVEICNKAFYNSSIQDLVLTDAKLGEFSFAKSLLSSVVLNGKCELEYFVFYSCRALRKFYSMHLDKIQGHIFELCGDFDEFITPNVKYISPLAFENTGELDIVLNNLNDLSYKSFSKSRGAKRIYTKTKKISSSYYLNLDSYEYLLYYYDYMTGILRIFESDEKHRIKQELGDDILSQESRDIIIQSVFG